MENFKNFEIENQEMIFGGVLQPTEYSNAGGGGGTDYLDTEKGRVIYPS